MATLAEFFRTGTLGPVSFGLTPEDVRGMLGLPTDQSVQTNPLILKYGGAQLTFLATKADPERRLAQTGLYFWPNAEPIPDRIRPTDWMPTGASTEADIRTYLTHAGIAVHSQVEGEDNSHLILETGASVTFANGYLAGLHARAKSRPASRVPVPVGEKALAALTVQAKRTNRAVADVAASWLAEKADQTD